MISIVALTLLVQALVLAGIIGVVMYIMTSYTNRITKTFQVFANRHGLLYAPFGLAAYKGLLIPGIITKVVSGTDKQTGKNVQLFHSVHTTGSGKSRRSYERTIAAVSTHKARVHAFINSTLNDLGEQVSLDTAQRYIAEGDFGKYFEMYFPDREHTKGLSLFAPDVMQLVMADYGFNDIEVLDDVVYLYEYKRITKAAELEQFYQKALSLAAAIDDNAPRRVNLQVAQGSTTAVPSLSRGHGKLWQKLMIAAIFLTAFGQMFTSPTSRAGALAGLMYLGVWVVVILVILGGVVKTVFRRYDYSKSQHFYRKK